MFGLSGNEGNHGEDVKEYYLYLDSTPTHSYMKYLYKYPQAEFPYRMLWEENRKRDKSQPEFELSDTGVFEQDRYFDVLVEYAKAGVDDILVKISVTNRGPESAPVHLLPTIWFRNTWSWEEPRERPQLRQVTSHSKPNRRTHPSRSHPALAALRRRFGTPVYRERNECASGSIAFQQDPVCERRHQRLHR